MQGSKQGSLDVTAHDFGLQRRGITCSCKFMILYTSRRCLPVKVGSNRLMRDPQALFTSGAVIATYKMCPSN